LASIALSFHGAYNRPWVVKAIQGQSG